MSGTYSNTRPEVAVSDASTLPQRYYTDPEWFQREMEAVHFDMWLCAGRTEQIARPGDYFLRRVHKVSGFREADYPLNPVATEIWDGHIFINLSARPMPFAEHLAGLDRKFANWGMNELQLVERRVYPLKTNW